MLSYETRDGSLYWLWAALYGALLVSFLFSARWESSSSLAAVTVAIVFLLHGFLLLSDGLSGMRVTIDGDVIAMRRWNGFGGTRLTEVAVAEYQDIRHAVPYSKAVMLLASGQEIRLGISGAKGVDVAGFIATALRERGHPTSLPVGRSRP